MPTSISGWPSGLEAGVAGFFERRGSLPPSADRLLAFSRDKAFQTAVHDSSLLRNADELRGLLDHR
jgi:hypothetical protein